MHYRINLLLPPYTVTCPRGHLFDQRTEDCVPCREGLYQDQEAQVRCKECPNGTWTEGRGARSVSECYGNYTTIMIMILIIIFIYLQGRIQEIWIEGGGKIAHNELEAWSKSLTAEVQGPLMGPGSSRVLDDLSSYLSLILKHSDTKLDLINI